ncbi:MAG: SCP2 sterol-binding domain-containing protein, partial [Rhodospirillales bacterium]|nr:SCP2 sterol-binding domain-containing protein [Rhodospirillales bacterium]
PVLLAGMAMRPLPPGMLQPVLTAALRTVLRRHPEVFERLAALDDPVFLIDPIDLPFVFIMRPDPSAPELRAVRDGQDEPFTAAIRGSMLALTDLLEGRIDGDSLFFSRDLEIEGDTEAVVALRNAVDGAEIDVFTDIAALFGPAAGPARRLAAHARGLLDAATRDMESLRAAITAPATRRAEAQAARLDKLEEKVQELGRAARRAAPAASRTKRSAKP